MFIQYFINLTNVMEEQFQLVSLSMMMTLQLQYCGHHYNQKHMIKDNEPLLDVESRAVLN